MPKYIESGIIKNKILGGIHMDLEYFMNKTLNKIIKIESVHSDGELGIITKLSVVDAEIEKQEHWNGFKLKINNANIVICFDWQKPSKEYMCRHILELYRSGEVVVAISLPEEDTWE